MYSSNLKWMRRDKSVTKREVSESNTFGMDSNTVNSERAIQLNDIGFRLVLIPFFGIAIPLITGMMESVEFTSWSFKVSFLYTIGIAWIVWEGNRFLLFTLRNYFDWFEKPLRKIAALIFVVPFYTIPISVILLVLWYQIFSTELVEWEKIRLATALILICVIFIVHVYETVFLVKEAESEKLMNAQLEKARAQAELQSLKSQIDPHFIFNSLNTLSYFIDKDPETAKVFNQKLSDVYRYILQNRDKDFILLKGEMEFVQDYFTMLQLRFDKALEMEVNIPNEMLDEFAVLPISIQLLIENAIKHNEFSVEEPLRIKIYQNESAITIENPIRRKRAVKSSGTGLMNLGERSKLLLDRTILVTDNNRIFKVQVPLKPIL